MKKLKRKIILLLFKMLIPKNYGYRESEIIKFIDYQIKRENDKTYWSVQQYDEDIKMLFCSSLAKSIENDIKTEDNPYLGMRTNCKKPKNDFEKGVMSSINLIYHRQHCMNPS